MRAMSRNMPVAALTDVLTEQFGYLLCHVGPCVIPNCPDCARFDKVETLLVAPFGVINFDPPVEIARAA